MTSRLSDEQRNLYQRALDGEINLIGWGVRPNFHLHRWQEGYPIKTFVDTNFALWDTRFEKMGVLNPMALRDFDPKSHAVINYYNSKDVDSYAKRVAGITSLPPKPLQHLLFELSYTKNIQPSYDDPLSLSHFQNLLHVLDHYIKDHRPMPQKLKNDLSKYRWDTFIKTALPHIQTRQQKEQTVVLACNSLYPGGAERQIVNLSVGFHQAGWQTHFLTTMNEGAAPHYLEPLRKAGIGISFAQKDLRLKDKAFIDQFLNEQTPEVRAVLWHLPIEYILQIVGSMLYLQKVRPRVLIAYLDWSNIIAAMAGLLTGVPEIIISGRSLAPPHYPQFFAHVEDSMRILYRILSTCPNVHFTNNARYAAGDYASWLKIDRDNIRVIPNCLTPSFSKRPKEAVLKATRTAMGIKRSDKVVLGVFRLSNEKRPELFVKCLARLIKEDKSVKGILCGDGPLLPSLQNLAKKQKIENRLLFAGNVDNVQELMGVSDILLHTAEIEGLPNAIIEAQSQALPVVSCRIGSILDCLAPALHPYCLENGSLDGLVDATHNLLKKPALKNKLGKEAQAYVLKNFSVRKLVDRNMSLIAKGKK